MLPTKAYFQDIECPFYNTSCERPYCHFLHKRKSEKVKPTVTVPTYKPTPKSELANIHSKAHIPISYVPDLAFKRERTVTRPIRIDKPTYKPTPISILSNVEQDQYVPTESIDKIEESPKVDVPEVVRSPKFSSDDTPDVVKEVVKKVKSESKHSRHRKEVKKDSKKRHSSSRKHSKSSRKRSRTRSRERHKSKRSKSNKKKVEEEKKEEPKIVVETEIELSEIEDDEDETLKECFKIFNEYQPPEEPKLEENPIETPPPVTVEDETEYSGKKRLAHQGAATTSKMTKTLPKINNKLRPDQMLANRYKLAKLQQANNEQQNIINEVKLITQKPKTLLEAAKLHNIKNKKPPKKTVDLPVVDSILNGMNKPIKKIVAAPSLGLIRLAKERISLVKNEGKSMKTIAQTQKIAGGKRVAHIPEHTLDNIPDVLQADKSKLPVNVRTRFLITIAEECGKLYALKEDAHNRALAEEFACYEKCKVLATYRNSAMLAVNRIRKELADRQSKGLGRILSGETLKPNQNDSKSFYDSIQKWTLSEDDLDLHGYPREGSERGRAIIKNATQEIEDYSMLAYDNLRKCIRCSKTYKVDAIGWPLVQDECIYHPLKKRTIQREQKYLCCKSNDDTGCATSDNHVFDGLKSHLLEGYQTTLPPATSDDQRSFQVYALDCEMCYTTKGLELTRVTIIDRDCKTVYESLVKPLNPIVDYNTRFSGITKDQMDRTSTSILQVQANILHLCNSNTILVGHSLESDMKALKIIHTNIVDTAVLFPHKMGLPHKRALRALASEYLKKIIQNDVNGHDSAEDAIACMELIKWKLKEDSKVKMK